MNGFKISDKLWLPLAAATWVISFIAKRGAGKTHNAGVLAEEMFKNGVPIVVIDPMGIFYGLRVGKGGHGNGLPIVVIGGEHADLPLIPAKAAEIAKAIVDTNISCVLDLSRMSKGEMLRVVTAFLNELYNDNRVDRHVFIEEADVFAPQKPFGPDATMCLNAVDNFVRRGGNKNLGCSLITQRSAVLSKDLLTQSDALVVMRTLAPQDKKAIQAWVEEQAEDDKSKMKRWYDSLNILENGEAWIWKPDNPKIFEKVKFRPRETFHATREFIKTPQAATIRLMDVGEFVTKFKDLAKVEEARKADVASLQQRVKELEAELRRKSVPMAQPEVSPERIREIERVAMSKGANEVWRQYGKREKELLGLIEKQNSVLQNVARLTGQAVQIEVPKPSVEAKIAFGDRYQGWVDALDARSVQPHPAQGGMAMQQAPVVQQTADQVDGEAKPLRDGAMRMLKAAAQFYPKSITREQMAAWTQFSVNGGTFNTYFNELKKNGWISVSGDDVTITDDGLDAAGPVDPLPTDSNTLIETWASKFRDGAAKMLRFIASRYPEWVSDEEIGQNTGFAPTGGTYSTYRGELVRNKLVEKKDGMCRASPTLFMKA